MFCPQFCPALCQIWTKMVSRIGDEGLTRLAASLPQLLSLLQLSLLSLNTKTAFPKQLSLNT